MTNIKNFSIWCDFVERDFLSNEFANLVDSGIVSGITSNPAIFKKAFSSSKKYDEDKEKSLNLSAKDRYELLIVEDIKIAAKTLFPIYESKNVNDGFASIEVDPLLSDNAKEMVKEGKRLYEAIGFKNTMIKIPATTAGYQAIKELIELGINVNATLVFSPTQTRECINAIQAGNKLFEKKNKTAKLPKVVISVFVSRLDRKVDAILKGHRMAVMRLGIMNASYLYQMIEESKIPNVRCLFASTGVSDSVEDKSYYIKKLMYNNAVNTAPLSAIKHYIENWDTDERACPTKENVSNYFKKLESLGINMSKIYKELIEEGLTQFNDAHNEIIDSLSSRTFKEMNKISIEIEDKVKPIVKKIERKVKEKSSSQLEILKKALDDLVATKGSDLHIKADSSIKGRVNGSIVTIDNRILTKDDMEILAKELLKERYEEFSRKTNLDFMFKLNDNFRFRVNIFFQIDGISAVFRAIPATLPTLESMELPKIIENFCGKQRGLVLVTGPTGCGKSTTLAAIINIMNQTSQKHIITIEDPIEFVYEDDQSIINQRSVGQNALSFSDALIASLREDPDVIMVGEMRDVDTIKTAIRAAETGHLVLSTLHTTDAKETINRIISMFSGEEQKQVRQSLASVLYAVVSQRLLKKKDGGGRVAAVELLIKNNRIEQLIATGRESEIKDAIEEGRDVYRSQSFNQALLDLYVNEKISYQEAIRGATSPSDLKILLDNYEAQKNKDAKEELVFEKDHDVIELKL